MQTIEKVIFLRGVGIFASVDDEYLAEVARRMNEVRLAPAQVLFEKGDEGHLMYIIVSGRVRVHSDNRTIAELGEQEVIGEMAVLDPERRSASVTAIQDTLLLSLTHRDMYALIEADVEVARGLIRVLCRRLRKTVNS